MATIKRFEDLEIWQLARVQCQEIDTLIIGGHFQNDIPLRDQMNRSTASVMDNIGEGFDRFTKADFRHFLVIARGSNAEARSQMYRAFDRRYIDQQTFDRLKMASLMLSVKLHNFINYLIGTQYKSKPGNETYRNGSDQTLSEPPMPYYPSDSYDLPEEFIGTFPQ